MQQEEAEAGGGTQPRARTASPAGRGTKDSPLQVPGGSQPCHHLGFGLTASRTVRRYTIPATAAILRRAAIGNQCLVYFMYLKSTHFSDFLVILLKGAAMAII